MINDVDAAYIAGLFDGEGNIYYKQIMVKRGKDKKAYPTWQIRMEISMTERSIIHWIHETLAVGTFHKKPPGKGQMGRKMQYRWRCGFRDAYYVCKVIWPFVHVKIDKVQKILEHYACSTDNVVRLDDYKALKVSGRKLPLGID